MGKNKYTKGNQILNRMDEIDEVIANKNYKSEQERQELIAERVRLFKYFIEMDE